LSDQGRNLKEIDNRQLVDECLRSRSVDAWQEFVRRMEPLISGVVAQVARRNGSVSNSQIDDLVQETYLKLCANNYKLLRDFSGSHENSLYAYLKVTAASVALDHFKSLNSQKRGGGLTSVNMEESEKVQPATAPPSFDPDHRLLLTEIDRTLAKVTEGPTAERDRLIFRLYYQQGFTAADIAGIPTLKLTAKGVESLLYRIVALVRRELVRPGAGTLQVKMSGDLAASGE
jgi:RNA polymerase sigma-70 factor, ECF subfamily